MTKRDRRRTPATPRVAHASLKGEIEAKHFTEGEPARVTAPLADLLAAPGGARDRQVLFGDRLTVVERHQGWAFVMAAKDGYCGWLAEAALGPDAVPTHRISGRATHCYPEPSLKSRAVGPLSYGATLTVTGESGKFVQTAEGWYVPRAHVAPVAQLETDPVAVAELFLGAPYLWGGNSHEGIDCSGLVQAALLACGQPCPGDSDQQRAEVGHEVDKAGPWQRGDLFFWPGHVAMAVDETCLIHANGFRAAVTHEGIEMCLARIDAAGEGPLLAVKRL
ncbi:NlpC/P60 family protein [Frigidibacter sp. MR17.14]|uniref:C40 family peptidase n=1 Tax=Frigidibacter sp. MR17.14 TaxID=3126509 RepID=UPI003012EF05